MVSNLRVTILAGAVALALGGPALANTNLDNGTTGDVFINVVDTTNSTSFLYDTGLSQASFNSTGSYTYTFSSDANYLAFKAAEGGSDVLTYSVLSATTGGSLFTPTGEMLFTSNASVSGQIGTNIGNALTGVGGFFTQANLNPSTTTNSSYLPSATTWGQTVYEQFVASKLGVPYTTPGTGVDALVGTALNFYIESSSNTLDTSNASTSLATAAYQWNYNNGVATYGPSTVPLPTPVLLLLSGLGLMGVVARRGKGASGAAAG